MTIWMKIVHLLYLTILLMATILAVKDLRRYVLPLKMIALLITSAFVIESIALYLNLQGRSTRVVYYIFALLEVVWVCLYFIYSVPALQRYKIGYLLCFTTLAYGLLLINGPSPDGNSPISLTFVKCLLLVGLSIYASYKLAISQEEFEVWGKQHKLWVPTLISFYWVGTLLCRGIYPHLPIDELTGYALLHYTMVTVNIITYSGYALVLFNSIHSKKTRIAI